MAHQAVHRALGPKHGGDWAAARAALASDLSHAPKLAALQELLLDAGGWVAVVGGLGVGWGGWADQAAGCRPLRLGTLTPVHRPPPPTPGIGREPGVKAEAAEADEVAGASDAGHRVLIFAQLKVGAACGLRLHACHAGGTHVPSPGFRSARCPSCGHLPSPTPPHHSTPAQGLLDLVEAHVLAPLRVSSLRIDGGVEAAERFRRVQRFNADPTIDVMLLTTQVRGGGGGEGEAGASARRCERSSSCEKP